MRQLHDVATGACRDTTCTPALRARAGPQTRVKKLMRGKTAAAAFRSTPPQRFSGRPWPEISFGALNFATAQLWRDRKQSSTLLHAPARRCARNSQKRVFFASEILRTRRLCRSL